MYLITESNTKKKGRLYSMRQNRAMGHIKTILLTIIIVACVLGGLYYVQLQYGKAKVKTIRTNMSLVQFKATEYLNKQKAEGKEEMDYIGTNLSEIMEDNIVVDMIDKGIITEDECEEYYMLSNEDLEELGTKEGNEDNSYYLINYETGEVIITSGCRIEKNKTLYKLSEIIKADEESENKEKKSNEESEEDSEEDIEESEEEEEDDKEEEETEEESEE